MSLEEFRYDYDLEKLQTKTPQKRNFRMMLTQRYVNYFVQNIYEDFTSDLLLGFTRDDMLFIDIGAHYGYYTLLVGTRHPNSRIVSFEPVPENCEILRRNVEELQFFWLRKTQTRLKSSAIRHAGFTRAI